MARDIGNAGFIIGVFGALHVRANGDFACNDGDPIVSGGRLQPGFAHLPALIAQMKAGGNVTRLLFRSVAGARATSSTSRR